MKKTISFLVCFILSHPLFAFYTANGVIYDENHQPVTINGISWSGFQDTGILQGLASLPFYAAPTNSYSPKPYGMMDALIHPEGGGVSFKTVRIPIQPGVLYDTNHHVDINISISNKNEPTKGNGIFCKTWETSGINCLSSVSSKEAFWITLQEMQKNQVNVLVDFHHREGYGDNYRDGTVYDLGQYEKDISTLLDGMKEKKLTNIIGIDVFNEPYQLSWFQENNGAPSWISVIAKATHSVYAKDKGLLLFVEGSGFGANDRDQPVTCVSASNLIQDNDAYTISDDPGHCKNGTKRVDFRGNWGEDFKPLLSKEDASNGRATFDRTLFLQKLKDNGLTDQEISWLMGDENGKNAHIVFSPHVYPKEVAGWESQSRDSSFLRFNWSFGFLKDAGYPIVFGESSWKTASGKSFFEKSVVPYLKENNMPSHLFFWAIGYLGDTVSLIDPNDGSVNQEAEKTLLDLFGG